mgnify:CR=1 FL=1
MLHDRLTLIELVADALVVGDRDAALGSAVFQPLLVGTDLWKQIVMPLDVQAGTGENGGKLFPEVAVGEIDAAQAARS